MINKEEYLRGVEAAANLIQIATKEDHFEDYVLKIIHEHLDDCENDDATDVLEDFILGFSDMLREVADRLEKIGYKD